MRRGRGALRPARIDRHERERVVSKRVLPFRRSVVTTIDDCRGRAQSLSEAAPADCGKAKELERAIGILSDATTPAPNQTPFRVLPSCLGSDTMEKIMRRFASRADVLVATLTFGVGLSIPVAGQAQTHGWLVECRIESAGKVEVNGKCRFAPGAGGSFALENANFRENRCSERSLWSASRSYRLAWLRCAG